jgi:hypothetical protein
LTAAVRRDKGRHIASASLPNRIGRLDWPAIERGLDERGHATIASLLTRDECARLAALYADERRFRTRVDMARHRFGEGEYKYFAAPLPPLVAALRAGLYPRLVAVANRWATALGTETYAPTLAAYLACCAAAGQRRPTPLLLRYTSGGYNCLHQDLYGPLAFPLQLTCLLAEVGEDYTGGEFLLVEQRPRAQSRGEAIVLRRGDAIVFATRHRPASGTRGVYRVTMRHGVSQVRSGERVSLGIIFHDAA